MQGRILGKSTTHKMRGWGGEGMQDRCPGCVLGVSWLVSYQNFPPRAKLNVGEGKEEREGTGLAMGALSWWVLVVCMSIST